MKLARQRYVTTRDHGEHPAGTACWVSRVDEAAPLVIEWDDGATMEMPGYYAHGLEDCPTIFSLMADEIGRDIDRQVLGW